MCAYNTFRKVINTCVYCGTSTSFILFSHKRKENPEIFIVGFLVLWHLTSQKIFLLQNLAILGIFANNNHVDSVCLNGFPSEHFKQFTYSINHTFLFALFGAFLLILLFWQQKRKWFSDLCVCVCVLIFPAYLCLFLPDISCPKKKLFHNHVINAFCWASGSNDDLKALKLLVVFFLV